MLFYFIYNLNSVGENGDRQGKVGYNNHTEN